MSVTRIVVFWCQRRAVADKQCMIEFSRWCVSPQHGRSLLPSIARLHAPPAARSNSGQQQQVCRICSRAKLSQA